MKYLFLILLLSAGAKSCNESSSENANVNEEVEKTTKTLSKDRLHDIWALTAIDGIAIDKDKYNAGVPTLEIYVADQKINGFSGCNDYFASIDTLTEEEIRLGPIASTKKYCIGIDEKAFFERMNQVNRYSLEKMQLNLFKADSLLLSFKKVD